jgi:hypothetical protein
MGDDVSEIVQACRELPGGMLVLLDITTGRLDCAPLVTTLTTLDEPVVPPSEVAIATEPVEVERPEQLDADDDNDWRGVFILAAVVCAILGLLTLVYS